MIRRALPILSLAAGAPLIVSAAPPGDLDGTIVAQQSFRQRIVIRIPRLPPRPAARASYAEEKVEWRERKAPRCVSAATLAAATISDDGDVDLVVTDGTRLRAKLDDDCPTLSFYRGFYLKRAADGMLCAGRDALRSRSGARCEIDRFRTLVARR